jgi:glycosyltransferase involved in cell wall biosynthesis
MLRADGVAVELDIVGSGDLRPYAALWQLDGVRAKNRWLDETDIAAALLHSDLLILPYVEASQSGVAPAAASAGLPVVATPVGGLEEQVRHGVTGLIAESTAPASLAAAIRRLIEDDALYARCSSGALAHARDELGWDAIAVKLTGIAVAAAREREDGKCLS